MVYSPFILISCVKNPRYASTVWNTPSEARRKWFWLGGSVRLLSGGGGVVRGGSLRSPPLR